MEQIERERSPLICAGRHGFAHDFGVGIVREGRTSLWKWIANIADDARHASPNSGIGASQIRIKIAHFPIELSELIR